MRWNGTWTSCRKRRTRSPERPDCSRVNAALRVVAVVIDRFDFLRFERLLRAARPTEIRRIAVQIIAEGAFEEFVVREEPPTTTVSAVQRSIQRRSTALRRTGRDAEEPQVGPLGVS